MSNATTVDHLKSLGGSLFSLVRSPESVPGYILETFSEWSRSRSWRTVWITTPFLIVNLAFFVTAGFFVFRSITSIVQASMTQVSKRMPLSDLERVAFEEHYIRNLVKERVVTSNIAVDATKEDGYAARPKMVADEKLVTSDKFLESEVLLNRALRASPESVQTTYQLALLTSLNTKLPNPQKTADELMATLAENSQLGCLGRD